MPPPRRSRVAIEVIDLSSDSEDDEVLPANESRTEPPIRQQNEAGDSRLSFLKCVICLDCPTDLTATNCGHLFCHECITAALKVSSAASGSCPVCRRKVTVKSLIPLAIMKGPVLGSDVDLPKASMQPQSPKDEKRDQAAKPKLPVRRNSRREANKAIEI